MFENINAFQLASSMARHASERQSVIATNIANADTPGFRAKDVTPFADHFDRWDWASRPFERLQGHPMLATRPETGAGTKPLLLTRPVENFGGSRVVDAPDETSPNGNTVALESQLVKSTVANRQHDMALAIYKTSLSFLKTAIGRSA